MNFNTFPATIALEKMEACKLFSSKSLNRNRSQSCFERAGCVDGLDEKFPTIEWEDDIMDSVFERAQQRISLVVKEREYATIGSQKRRKMSSGYFSDSRTQDQQHGLLRSKQIISELCSLDSQVEDCGLYHKTKPKTLYNIPSLDAISSFSNGRDVALEKRLQMSFCEDGGDSQVSIVA